MVEVWRNNKYELAKKLKPVPEVETKEHVKKDKAIAKKLKEAKLRADPKGALQKKAIAKKLITSAQKRKPLNKPMFKQDSKKHQKTVAQAKAEMAKKVKALRAVRKGKNKNHNENV